VLVTQWDQWSCDICRED